jgi:mRNA interferase MazF
MSKARVDKGDVVTVDVPYLDASRTVRRPALVVSDCSQMLDVIIAAITSRVRDPLPPCHYVIDRRHPDWRASGLRLDSTIRCDRLFTVQAAQIYRHLGSLSAQTVAEIDDLMKRALRLK